MRDLSEYAPDGADYLVRGLLLWLPLDPGYDNMEDAMYREAREVAHAARPTLLALERLEAAEARARELDQQVAFLLELARLRDGTEHSASAHRQGK